MKRITTLKGDIAPELLGVTTMHDHTLTQMSDMMQGRMFGTMPEIPEAMSRYAPENFAFFREGGFSYLKDPYFGSKEYYLKEFEYFAACGGQTIVDASPIGMRRVQEIQELIAQTDLHIVGATGLYTAFDRPQKYYAISKEEQMAMFEQEIHEGIEGTNMKPGLLKCAVSSLAEDKQSIHPVERTTVAACAEVAAKYGMSIHMHQANPLPVELILQEIDVMLNAGVAPDKIVIDHMDIVNTATREFVMNPDMQRIITAERQVAVLEKGVNISMDNWGNPLQFQDFMLNNDYERLKILVQLLQLGYGDHIVLGHDFAGFQSGKAMGNHGYTRILTFTLPMLKKLGFDDAAGRALVVGNPARILAY